MITKVFKIFSRNSLCAYFSVLNIHLQTLHSQAKEAERKAIRDGIQENGMEDSDKVVQSVLAARHADEEKNIDSEYAALKKLMVDDAIAKLHEKFNRKASDLSKKHEAELQELQVGI